MRRWRQGKTCNLFSEKTMLGKSGTAALQSMSDDVDVDIVQEGSQAYVGNRRTSGSVVKSLLRCMAIKKVEDDGKLARYRISDIGRSILRRPKLADEVYEAVLGRIPFQIIDDQIVLMKRDEEKRK
jgi:hypothetical protein